MFNLKLLDDEEIKLIDNDVLLKTDSDYINVTVIITNKRLLILDYPKGLDALKFGKMINYPEKKEIFFGCNLDDITLIGEENDFHKYMFKDKGYFYLQSDEVRNYLSKM